MIRARLLSFGMVVTVGFIMLVSLVVSAVISALAGRVDRRIRHRGAVHHRQVRRGSLSRKSSVVSSFGAAGSLAVLLLWVYYSSHIFLLGAESTWVYADRYGSPCEADRPATARQTAATTRRPQGEAAQPAGGPVAPPRAAASPMAPRMRAPAPHHDGLVALIKPRPGAATGVALVLGAIAGGVVNLRQARAATPTAQSARLCFVAGNRGVKPVTSM